MAKKTSKPKDASVKKKKEQTSDPVEKQAEKKFPGYPHYRPEEDIMDPSTGMEKENIDVEDFSRLKQTEGKKSKSKAKSSDDELMENPVPSDLKNEDLEITPGTETDVT